MTGDRNGWLPIETAPKDETWIISWNGDEVVPATWVDDAVDCGSGDVGWCYGDARWGGVLYDGINLMGRQPTHWMPLPPPPTTIG